MMRVFLVAAEPSGDSLAAGMIQSLREQLGDEVEFAGVGGPLMAAEGVESPFDIKDLSILGLFDGLKSYSRIKQRVRETAEHARQFKPDVAVLVDSWGFMIRVARAIREEMPETGLVKYVGPQIWATRAGRAKVLANAVDHLLTIHSFDAPLFEAAGLPTTFVGNASLESVRQGDGVAFRARHGIANDAELIGVLMGSRPSELRRLKEPFFQAISELRAERPDARFVMPLATALASDIRAMAAQDSRLDGVLLVGDSEKIDAFAAMDIALACSGTVTTQLSQCGIPTVAAYRLGWITYWLLRLVLFKGQFISLVNIAANRAIIPERIQMEANGAQLAEDISGLLNDPVAQAAMRSEMIAITDEMRGKGKAAQRAAQALIQFVQNRS